VDEWQSDVFTKTQLDYNLALDVWNRRGRIMTSVRVRGKDTLPTSTFFNPAQNASIVAPQALEKNLELLLNNEKVANAISMVKSIDALGAKY
jgi:hypothetical protein